MRLLFNFESRFFLLLLLPLSPFIVPGFVEGNNDQPLGTTIKSRFTLSEALCLTNWLYNNAFYCPNKKGLTDDNSPKTLADSLTKKCAESITEKRKQAFSLALSELIQWAHRPIASVFTKKKRDSFEKTLKNFEFFAHLAAVRFVLARRLLERWWEWDDNASQSKASQSSMRKHVDAGLTLKNKVSVKMRVLGLPGTREVYTFNDQKLIDLLRKDYFCNNYELKNRGYYLFDQLIDFMDPEVATKELKKQLSKEKIVNPKIIAVLVKEAETAVDVFVDPTSDESKFVAATYTTVLPDLVLAGEALNKHALLSERQIQTLTTDALLLIKSDPVNHWDRPLIRFKHPLLHSLALAHAFNLQLKLVVEDAKQLDKREWLHSKDLNDLYSLFALHLIQYFLDIRVASFSPVYAHLWVKNGAPNIVVKSDNKIKIKKDDAERDAAKKALAVLKQKFNGRFFKKDEIAPETAQEMDEFIDSIHEHYAGFKAELKQFQQKYAHRLVISDSDGETLFKVKHSWAKQLNSLTNGCKALENAVAEFKDSLHRHFLPTTSAPSSSASSLVDHGKQEKGGLRWTGAELRIGGPRAVVPVAAAPVHPVPSPSSSPMKKNPDNGHLGQDAKSHGGNKTPEDGKHAHQGAAPANQQQNVPIVRMPDLITLDDGDGDDENDWGHLLDFGVEQKNVKEDVKNKQ